MTMMWMVALTAAIRLGDRHSGGGVPFAPLGSAGGATSAHFSRAARTGKAPEISDQSSAHSVARANRNVSPVQARAKIGDEWHCGSAAPFSPPGRSSAGIVSGTRRSAVTSSVSPAQAQAKIGDDYHAGSAVPFSPPGSVGGATSGHFQRTNIAEEPPSPEPEPVTAAASVAAEAVWKEALAAVVAEAAVVDEAMAAEAAEAAEAALEVVEEAVEETEEETEEEAVEVSVEVSVAPVAAPSAPAAAAPSAAPAQTVSKLGDDYHAGSAVPFSSFANPDAPRGALGSSFIPPSKRPNHD